jgi:predicted nucleic acid-binding protein
LVVSNTSPLVYLAALGDFTLLHELFSEIVIPRAVFHEIAIGGAGLPAAAAVQEASVSWLTVKEVGSTSRLIGSNKLACILARPRRSCSPLKFILRRY